MNHLTGVALEGSGRELCHVLSWGRDRDHRALT